MVVITDLQGVTKAEIALQIIIARINYLLIMNNNIKKIYNIKKATVQGGESVTPLPYSAHNRHWYRPNVRVTMRSVRKRARTCGCCFRDVTEIRNKSVKGLHKSSSDTCVFNRMRVGIFSYTTIPNG